MAKPKMSPERRLAIEIFSASGIIALFLLVLSIPFINPILGPLLVILLCLVLLWTLRQRKPELFEALKKPKSAENNDEPEPDPTPKETHRAYLMLIGLNESSKYRVTVNESPFVIGTDKKSNFVIDDKYVSSRHMLIEYDDAAKSRCVTDLSRNGTFLNNKRLQKGLRVALQHGDTLQIGDVIFSVEYVHF